MPATFQPASSQFVDLTWQDPPFLSTHTDLDCQMVRAASQAEGDIWGLGREDTIADLSDASQAGDWMISEHNK